MHGACYWAIRQIFLEHIANKRLVHETQITYHWHSNQNTHADGKYGAQ